MTIQHYIGISITLLAIVSLSIYSSKSSKSKKGANSLVVAGAIMGTLVGGSSTVGTAQLAYTYGMSAWCFTLGSGYVRTAIITAPLKAYNKREKHRMKFVMRCFSFICFCLKNFYIPFL